MRNERSIAAAGAHDPDATHQPGPVAPKGDGKVLGLRQLPIRAPSHGANVTDRVPTLHEDQSTLQVVPKPHVRRAPRLGRSPGDPPPFDAAAKHLYSSDALASWWSDLLTQPASESQAVALAPPLTGTLRRTWTGSDFALGLPEGVSQLPVHLVDGVNAVTGNLSSVSGTGHLSMSDGVVAKTTGEVRYTLNLTALTQAVEQQHHQQWTLERWTPTPADKTP